MKLCVLFAALLVGLILISSASAVVYVKWDSPGPEFDGKSWETAFHTISEGVSSAATTPDEVRVARGRYPEGVFIPESVTLKGGYLGVGDARDIKANTTFIDGLWNYEPATESIVAVTHNCTLDGFTVRGFCAVSCWGVCTVSNNTIMGVDWNSGRESTGISAMYSNPTIVNNTILDVGYGLTGYWMNCSVVGNVFVGCGVWAIDMSGGAGEIVNNTIVSCGNGVSAWEFSTVINNIIAFNYNAGLQAKPSESIHHNCLYGNGFYNEIGDIYPDYADPTAARTNVYGDPQLLSVEYGNFHLRPTSPCRDAGAGSELLPDLDMDGQNRIDRRLVDIGADESYGEEYGAVVPRIVYVNADAAPGGDGTSWTRAFRKIQDAVDTVLLNRPAEIWVANGTYVECVRMNPFARLYGGFDGTETVREARDPAGNVTTIAALDSEFFRYPITGASRCAVDGFALRDGLAGVHSRDDDIMVRNCSISHNDEGIWAMGGNPSILNSRICGNAGTGVDVAGGVTVANCLISGNGGNGLTAYTEYWSFICNNTIVDNKGMGLGCGGLVYGDYNAVRNTVANNIVAYNEVGVVTTLREDWMNQTLATNNDVSGNAINTPNLWPWASNMHSDPLFVDRFTGDYHLTSASPCIDAGYAPLGLLPPTDLDGRDRIRGASVDIGAFEFQPLRITAAIDVRPGESPNRINLGSHAVVPVAIFTSPSFDATKVDPATAEFAGAPAAKAGGSGRLIYQLRDVDRDGRVDMVISFETDKMSIPAGATSAALSGSTSSGTLFEGSDTIVIVGR